MIDDLLTEDEARPLLEPHFDGMRECVEEGWAEWRSITSDSPRLALVRPTSRANVVYDFIADRLEAYFETAGVPTSKKKRFLSASIGGGAIEIRLKKFSHPRRLTTSGIPTYQRLEMLHQATTLDGMTVTHVTVGYYPDELGQSLDVVAVACHYGRKLVWHVDLLDDGTVAAAPAALQPRDDLDGPSVRSTRRETAAEGAAEAK